LVEAGATEEDTKDEEDQRLSHLRKLKPGAAEMSAGCSWFPKRLIEAAAT